MASLFILRSGIKSPTMAEKEPGVSMCDVTPSWFPAHIYTLQRLTPSLFQHVNSQRLRRLGQVSGSIPTPPSQLLFFL